MGIVLTCTTCSNPFEGNGNGGGGGVRRAQILWFVAGSGGGRPAYDGTTAYFLAGTDEVLAIDAITGAVRWHATMGAAAGSTPIFGSAVCTVVAAIVACGDTDVVAFSRNDGSRMWRFHPAVGYYPGYYEIAALGSTLYTGSPSGTMYAIDANTGGTHWIASIGVLGVNTSVFSPIVDSDIVVAAYKRFSKVPTGGVVAIDVKSGQIRWQTDFPHPAADSGSGGLDAALWGNLVLASCDDGRIYAFDRTTGQVLWSLPGVGRAPPSYAIPNGLITHDTREIVINNNRLYASSLADWVIGYDLTTQTEVWRSSTTLGSTNTQPIATDGTWVYDVLAGGQVMAFAVADGKAAWSFTQDATAIFGTVTPAGDRVFVSGQKGFYALSK